MKAMKKILFLTLIFALALSATAFAVVTDYGTEQAETAKYLVQQDEAGLTQCGYGHETADGATISVTSTGNVCDGMIVTVECNGDTDCVARGTMKYTVPAAGCNWESTGLLTDANGKQYITGYEVTKDANGKYTIVAESLSTTYAKAATATENGNKITALKCSVCGDVRYTAEVVYAGNYVPEHDHEFDADFKPLTKEELKKEGKKNTDATCTTPAKVWGVSDCSTCGKTDILWEKTIVNGLKDDAAEIDIPVFVNKHLKVYNNLTEAADVQNGETVNTATAELVVAEYRGVEEKNYVKTATSTNSKLTYVIPTCANDGKGSLNVVCPVETCKATILTLDVVDKEAHSGPSKNEQGEYILPINGNKTNIKEIILPSCTEAGHVLYTCDICHKEVYEAIGALGHSYESNGPEEWGFVQYGEFVVSDEPQDDADECAPYYEAVRCVRPHITVKGNSVITTICGEVKKTGIEQPAKWNHNFTAENIDNLAALKRVTLSNDNRESDNCAIDKSVVVTCNGCDKYEKLIVTKLAGHNFKAVNDPSSVVIQDQTCYQDGIVEVKCVNYAKCGATDKVNVGKIAHTPTSVGAIDKNCETSTTIVIKCVVEKCGAEIERYTVEPGHTFDGTATATNMEYVDVDGDGDKEWIIIDCTKDATIKGTCTKCKQTNRSETYKAKAAHTKPVVTEKWLGDKTMTQGAAYATEDIYRVCDATCQNIGIEAYNCKLCKQAVVNKTSDMLKHFGKVDESKTVIVSYPTCQVEGEKIEFCAYCPADTADTNNDQARTVAIPVVDHVYNKVVNNKKVCQWCGEAADVVDGHEFVVLTDAIKMTSTSISGRGKIEPTNFADFIKHYNQPAYARINYNFTLENGENVAYVACVEIDWNGEFRVASPSCPYGAQLTNVAIMITTDGNAQDKLISEVPNMGITTLR